MARQSYLIRRGGSYSARMRVPADLVEAIGRKELVKALGTNDPAEAKRRVWAVVESWLRRFDALRNRTAMTEEDRIDLISAHYFGIMERDEQRRAVIPTDAEIDVAMERAVERAQLEEIDVMDPIAALNLTLEVQVLKDQQAGPKSHDAFARRTKLNELRKHLTKGESALVQHEIDAYLDQNGLTIKPGSQEHTSLIRQLIRAEIEALQRTLERDEGNYGGSPADQLIKRVIERNSAAGGQEQAIMAVYEQFAAEYANRVTPDRINQMRRDVGILVQRHRRGLAT